MATASKYDTLADAILTGVGGESNVKSVTHCATRLRFQLDDAAKADKTAIEATPGVITVVEAGGQFQVVIGNTVNNVFEAMTARSNVSSAGTAAGGPLAKFIDLITSIFTPLLWVLAGTGLLKALLAVAVKIPRLRRHLDLRDPVRRRRCRVPVPAVPAGRDCSQEVRREPVHLTGRGRRAGLLGHRRGHPGSGRRHLDAPGFRRRRW
jgi:phosphotransferase system IIB component